MRKKQLVHHLFNHRIESPKDAQSYRWYLAILLATLLRMLNLTKLSETIAIAFHSTEFWNKQLGGALRLNNNIGSNASYDEEKEKLRAALLG